MNYFLWIDEQQKGPFEKEQILVMLRDGSITKQTLCFPESVVGDDGDWNPLCAIEGLLEESPAPLSSQRQESLGPVAPPEEVDTPEAASNSGFRGLLSKCAFR
ncbi:MAG: DUF4339 domain-containing protein [Verrucomicrobia bacterium]|nr:DUF4339 domain-containing protein [Verrucomicrobiota bacterium]HOF49500.1 DUF4339 domain-containing protein [Verrucomicrobiota bacterium]HOR72568.1 DUF4339 domain-containing protein [Verrucomicrobiota bacterium]HPK98293.1 DUF4339 domain-containing protein [Verrucomicrobiota bacterium]HPW82054.1 DUF4339 domain-containing protein [Verrucomicrobiota bacterium]